MIAHAERMRYRIAVLDSGNAQSLDAIQPFTPTSTHATPLSIIPG
jgi:hypothetical protein